MAKKKLVWVDDLRAQMVVPGRTNPLAVSSFYEQIKKHGFKTQLLPFEGTHRAYLTADESAEVLKHFKLMHWRKK